ncbi:hypothetical protein [Solicola sp. PLA-1-18]|uniref:ATP dependent DNA ligase n=1 Tax=Solicola sp. PLA-1-18 TaxID=3380532 RepID=UPI003B817EC0
MSQISGRLLLLGDVDGMSLLYVGHVRLDTVRDAASTLWAGMDDLQATECPFAVRPPTASARWCDPGVVVGVRFDGRNAVGRLRAPSLCRDAPTAPARRVDQLPGARGDLAPQGA